MRSCHETAQSESKNGMFFGGRARAGKPRMRVGWGAGVGVLGLESPSYGRGRLGGRSQASGQGGRSGEPGTAVPGCAAWMPPLRAQPFAIRFAASRLRVRPMVCKSAQQQQGEGVFDPSPPSPLPFQGRGVPGVQRAVLGLESPSCQVELRVVDLGVQRAGW